MLKCIDELTPNHLIVFRFVVENITSYKRLDSYQNLYDDFIQNTNQPDLDKYEFRMYLKDLETKTLIRFSRDVNEYGSSGGYIALESYEETDGIALTTIGSRLIELIKK